MVLNSSGLFSRFMLVAMSGNHWNGTDKQEVILDETFGGFDITESPFVSSALIA
jgi:hypothetical protein